MAEVVSGLLVGQRFESLEDFKSAIRNISVRQHWDLRVVRSNKKSVVLGCRSSPNCFFRVVCRANKNATHITSLQDRHSCRRNLGTAGSTPARSEASHVRFLLNEIPKLFDMKSKIKGQDVVEAVKRYHGYDISMRQAQRALTKLQPRPSKGQGHGQTAHREGSASQLQSRSAGQPGHEASFDPLAEDRGWAGNGLDSTLMDDDSLDQGGHSPTGASSAGIHVHTQQHSSPLVAVAPHVQPGPSEPSPLPTVQHHSSQISTLPPPPPPPSQSYTQSSQQIQLPPPQTNPKPHNQPQSQAQPQQHNPPPPPQQHPAPQQQQQQHQQPPPPPPPTCHPATAELMLTNFKIEFTCTSCGALNQGFFSNQANVPNPAYLPPHSIHPAATNARSQMDGVPNDTNTNTAATGFGAPEYEGNNVPSHARSIPQWVSGLDVSIPPTNS